MSETLRRGTAEGGDSSTQPSLQRVAQRNRHSLISGVHPRKIEGCACRPQTHEARPSSPLNRHPNTSTRPSVTSRQAIRKKRLAVGNTKEARRRSADTATGNVGSAPDRLPSGSGGALQARSVRAPRSSVQFSFWKFGTGKRMIFEVRPALFTHTDNSLRRAAPAIYSLSAETPAIAESTERAGFFTFWD